MTNPAPNNIENIARKAPSAQISTNIATARFKPKTSLPAEGSYYVAKGPEKAIILSSKIPSRANPRKVSIDRILNFSVTG